MAFWAPFLKTVVAPALAKSAIDKALISEPNRRATNAANKANVLLQKEFAQKGIQWRVADAKKAGISPLAALGAQLHSAAPTYVGSDPGNAQTQIGSKVADAMMQLDVMKSKEELEMMRKKNKLADIAYLNQLGRMEHERKTRQTFHHMYTQFMKNPEQYAKKYLDGATVPDGTKGNPKKLFTWFYDEFSQKVLPILNEEAAEGGEGTFGMIGTGYGLGASGMSDVFTKDVPTMLDGKYLK